MDDVIYDVHANLGLRYSLCLHSIYYINIRILATSAIECLPCWPRWHDSCRQVGAWGFASSGFIVVQMGHGDLICDCLDVIDLIIWSDSNCEDQVSTKTGEMLHQSATCRNVVLDVFDAIAWDHLSQPFTAEALKKQSSGPPPCPRQEIRRTCLTPHLDPKSKALTFTKSTKSP